ncbi:MAG: ADP-ribosylglycohydrolase family protein [Treponema sp.]|nr:ADP-ribosylglycohydrolase family protein [Treponema sp.]
MAEKKAPGKAKKPAEKKGTGAGAKTKGGSLLFRKVYGCLLGGIIGDAMGAPAEGMNYEDVKKKFGWIKNFEGAGTDDSAIKLILCEAIIKSNGHVTADEWAESFLANKKRFYNYFYIPVRNMFHKVESKLSLPIYAGYGNMHSSSSAMSISPMGIINACRPRQAAAETWDAASLIHSGPSTFCRDGACAIAAAVAEAMSPKATVKSILDTAVKYLHKDSSKELLDRIKLTMDILERTKEYEAFRKEYYKKCLGDIVSDSRETVPCVLALFKLANGDPVKAVEYGANFGRDADTIGTMIGALAGAFRGVDGFKPEWIAQIEASYGKMQNPSKDYKGVEAAAAPNQRELAVALIKVMLSKAEEELKAQELFCSLVTGS